MSEIQDPKNIKYPELSPENIIGKKFLTNYGGDTFSAEVKEYMGSDEGQKFLVALGEGQREEIMSYNDIIDAINQDIDPIQTIRRIHMKIF